MGSQEQSSKSGSIVDRRLNRRDFLKTAGVGAAALGVGGGLSGALAACGSSSSGGTSSSSSASGREIKVGFVTSESDPAMRDLAFQTGALFMITKPFTPDALKAALAQAVA